MGIDLWPGRQWQLTCGRGGNDKGLKVLSKVKRIVLLLGKARFLNTHEKIGFPIKSSNKMTKRVLGIEGGTKEE
jgi:hypothetical protein